MPRDLADVLHYFLPELEPDARPAGGSRLDEGACETRGQQGPPAQLPPAPLSPDTRRARPPARRDRLRAAPVETPPPLPILGIPIGDRDVVRAALTWNLAIETARLGAATVVLAPALDRDSPLWPDSAPGPMGVEIVYCPAHDLGDLYRAATDLSVARADNAGRGGVVFVRIPPHWLASNSGSPNPIRWLLLLTSAKGRDLGDAYRLTQGLLEDNPGVEIGITIHGVSAISEARNAFERLSGVVEERLGLVLSSYGLLVDDLHVYRSIASQKPIGLVHPQAPAARALSDVGRLIYEDARSRVLG